MKRPMIKRAVVAKIVSASAIKFARAAAVEVANKARRAAAVAEAAVKKVAVARKAAEAKKAAEVKEAKKVNAKPTPIPNTEAIPEANTEDTKKNRHRRRAVPVARTPKLDPPAPAPAPAPPTKKAPAPVPLQPRPRWNTKKPLMKANKFSWSIIPRKLNVARLRNAIAHACARKVVMIKRAAVAVEAAARKVAARKTKVAHRVSRKAVACLRVKRKNKDKTREFVFNFNF